MSWWKTTIFILLASCARTSAKAPVEPRLGELGVKRDIYLGISTVDEDGWIMTGDCDGLLHNSLAYLGGIVDYEDLKKAEQEPGRWTRTPKGDCLSTGRSKSTISRDMLLGLLLAAVHKGDAQTIQDLQDYADENDRFVGESDGSFDGRWRTYITPTFYGTMQAAKNFIRGKTLVTTRLIGETDYTDHLEALHMLLASRINGGLTNYGIEYANYLTKKDPNNAFYQALWAKFDNDNEGVQAKAVDILLREDLFPSDRLPTAQDNRCIAYLWMHGEKDRDWLPCAEGGEHPGHDLLFAAHVIFWGP